MSNTVFGVETSFGIHVPDSPASTDSGSDVDISTEEVINDPSNSVKKKGRGKALKWEEHLVEDKTGFILYQSLGDVVHDAAVDTVDITRRVHATRGTWKHNPLFSTETNSRITAFRTQ